MGKPSRWSEHESPTSGLGLVLAFPAEARAERANATKIIILRVMLDPRKLTWGFYVKVDVEVVNWMKINDWGSPHLKSEGERDRSLVSGVKSVRFICLLPVSVAFLPIHWRIEQQARWRSDRWKERNQRTRDTIAQPKRPCARTWAQTCAGKRTRARTLECGMATWTLMHCPRPNLMPKLFSDDKYR